MSDLQTAGVPPSTSLATTPEAKSANIIYILYLAALVVGVTSLVGVIMAYMNKDTAPEWLKSHYQYQIRTFWIGLLFAVVGVITIFVAIGFLVLLFYAVWYIVRCVKGMKQISLGAPMPNATTWLW
jgi:uncharacterized membrane protein